MTTVANDLDDTILDIINVLEEVDDASKTYEDIANDILKAILYGRVAHLTIQL